MYCNLVLVTIFFQTEAVTIFLSRHLRCSHPLQQELERLNIDNLHTWEPKRSSRVCEGAVTSVEARPEADQRRQEREREKHPKHMAEATAPPADTWEQTTQKMVAVLVLTETSQLLWSMNQSPSECKHF